MTVQPPTIGLLRAADVLEECIRHFLQTGESIVRRLSKYEAPLEAANLLALAVRYEEGLILLARDDLVLLPSAAVLSRTALEACTRAMWLIAPADVFEREARWLAHLRTECDAAKRSARELARSGLDGSSPRRTAKMLGDFADEVTRLLPAAVKVPKQVPNFQQTLEAVGKRESYRHYIELSQFAHATHAATNLYRKNLGNLKELGEFITPAHWMLVFEVAWDALKSAGDLFFAQIAPNERPFGINLPAKMAASINMIDVDE